MLWLGYVPVQVIKNHFTSVDLSQVSVIDLLTQFRPHYGVGRITVLETEFRQHSPFGRVSQLHSPGVIFTRPEG